MRFLYIFFLCSFAYYVVYGDSINEITLCNKIESKSPTLQLKRHLLCEYDTGVRPSHHNNVTVVVFRLLLKSVDFIDEPNSVYIHSWVILMWDDVFLTWDPSNYDGIDELHISSDEIWVPDVTVHNAADADISSRIPNTNCWVTNKGGVTCVSPIVYTTRCTTDNAWWPYNTQNCTIQFGSWSHFGDEIEFSLTQNNLTMDQYQKDLEWNIVRTYITQRIEPFKFNSDLNSRMFSIHLIFERHTNMLHSVFIVSAIVLMVLTLTTLWLDPKSIERMIVVNLNFICHLLCILDLHWQVPHNQENTPNILVFYESSLILATFTLILTTLLRYLQELKNEAPTWISMGASLILKSKVGQILLLSTLDPKASAGLETEADDNTDLVHPNEKESTWEYVTILIGWIAYFSVSISYIIIIVKYFPRNMLEDIYIPNN